MNKVISLFLISLMLLTNLPIQANAPSPYNANDGLSLEKTSRYNEKTNKIEYTLEAYQSGEVRYQESTVPMDVVLVLDQSGSMKETMPTGGAYLPIKAKTYGDLVKWLKDDFSRYPSREMYLRENDGDYVHVNVSRSLRGRIKIEKKVSGVWGWEDFIRVNEWDPIPEKYRFYSDKPHRIEVLKQAVDHFIGELQESEVEHQVALVGYGSHEMPNHNFTKYDGTKLLINQSGSSIQYDALQKEHYEKAFISVNDEQKVQKAIDNIKAGGATATYLGMDMARNILEANANDDRKQVVILFTDGSPNTKPSVDTNYTERNNGKSEEEYGGIYKTEEGDYINKFSTDSANESIRQAQMIKDLGADVYSIAVLEGADPQNISTNVNRFLHYLSSNFYEKNPVYIEQSRPLPDTNYYMTAENSEELNEIFATISESIVDGPEIRLEEEAVLYDRVAPEFEIDVNDMDDLRVTQHQYLGNGRWDEKGEDISEQVDLIVDEKSVQVEGFHYHDNLVLDGKDGTYSGAKIRLQFSAKPKDGFIGGKNIASNHESSGIYPSKEHGDDPVQHFPVPKVDIPLNFDYLVQDVSAHKLNQIDPMDFLQSEDAFYFGVGEKLHTLDGINNSSVDIDIKLDGELLFSIPKGTEIKNLPYLKEKLINLDKESQDYKIEFVLRSEDWEQVVEKEVSAYGFSPVVEVQNTKSFLGEAMTFVNNIQDPSELVWAHPEESQIPSINLDKYPQPELVYEINEGAYAYNDDKHYFEDDQDFDLKLIHEANDVTKILSGEDSSYEFEHKIVPLEFELKKSILGSQNSKDDQFVFDIEWKKPEHLNHFSKTYDTRIVLKGNDSVIVSGLPVGDYKVVENELWSWRYEAEGSNERRFTLEDDQKLSVEFRNKLKNRGLLTNIKNIKNVFKKEGD